MRIDVVATRSSTRSNVRFAIRDTGPGIRAEDQKRIFGEFYQADVSLTRAHGGTGLGLAIAKQLIHLMGGEIGFESVWGQGIHVLGGAALARRASLARGAAEMCGARGHPESERPRALERLTNPCPHLLRSERAPTIRLSHAMICVFSWLRIPRSI